MKKLFCSLIIVFGIISAASAQKRIVVPESKLKFEANDDYTEVTITGVDSNYFSSGSLKGKTLEIPSIIQGVPVTRIISDYGCPVFTDSGYYGIWIPDTVKYIGPHAFAYTYFTSIHLPEGLEEIGNECFFCCNAKTINIPSTVTKIGYMAFRNCKLESATIPEDCKIGTSAFWMSSLKKVTFPAGRVYLEWIPMPDQLQFEECNSLATIVTPEELELLYTYDYDDNKTYTLLDYVSGDKVRSSFALQKQLKGVKVKNAKFAPKKEPSAKKKAKKEPAQTTEEKTVSFNHTNDPAIPIDRKATSIVVPEGTKKIGEGLFYDCTSLTSITIPDSVTEIGDYAFYDCNALKTLTFTGSREKLDKIKIGKGNENFLRANLSCAYETEAERLAEAERNERLMSTIIAKISKGEKNIKIKGSYSDEDLKSLNNAIAKANQKIDLDLSDAQKITTLEWLTSFSNIEKVRLPKSLGKITVSLEEAKKIVPHPESKNIFAKDGILYTNMGKTVYAVVEDAKNYTVLEGTKEIKASVFKDSGLESISLPKSLANIWEYAFEGCTNLKTVNYAGSKKDWKNIYINNDGKGNKLLHKAKFVYGEK
jgi:hypothetical protein